MFEKKSKRPLTKAEFAGRMLCWMAFTSAILIVSLALGMEGYHAYEGLPWVDAFLNAAMILGGMGQVDTLHTEAGKIFAGAYAIYCGILLVVCGGLLLVPVFHRVLHRFHADE